MALQEDTAYKCVLSVHLHTYLDFPNQFPMTATKQGQQVDWNNPEDKQVQEIVIHLKHKCGIYCIGL